ncbi:hypothetical protein [Mycoplasma testudineum]|uniref:hypothetical protein n=1 Tax=Mycoplasma testudineum TaxID=244584 RepID=UPI000B941AAC|nr:hypothetical protein [Mycoplasma testudineum]OYD26459.1 hypothetical protein CG473_03915 [Mycoplasma testudineum]
MTKKEALLRIKEKHESKIINDEQAILLEKIINNKLEEFDVDGAMQYLLTRVGTGFKFERSPETWNERIAVVQEWPEYNINIMPDLRGGKATMMNIS